MKIIKKIREKLELDNPEKYIDGHYQLSKKQKWLWVGGLFLVGVVFFSIKGFVTLFSSVGISSNGLIWAIILSSVMLITLSFFLAFICYYPFFPFITKEERKKAVKNKLFILFQVWTVFLIAITIIIALKIALNFSYLAIAFLTIQFIKIASHKLNNQKL